MNVVFRADASFAISSGHIMRCLTLAQALREQGAKCHFVCKAHPGHLADLIIERGFSIILLTCHTLLAIDDFPVHAAWVGGSWQDDAEQTVVALQGQEVDCLVLDHYGLDARWQRRLRPVVRRILVIDDLADRPHDCDALLDQNIDFGQHSRYQALLPATARQLLGPHYLLLGAGFQQPATLEPGKILQRGLAFFGGADPCGYTWQLVNALEWPSLQVVVGANNPLRDEIEQRCHEKGWSFACNTPQMANLMRQADFAIISCGFTAYELASLYVPSLLVAVSDIQVKVAKALEAAGVACFVEDFTLCLSAAGLHQQLLRLPIQHPRLYRQFEYGGAERVAEWIMENTGGSDTV
ncbi:UDP-2,4-diacetamido-2,4,6-trideoxy-beta-L-altropyranose hydrolase [Vogesella fluminis]|uniref:UDP-2,4-diacetamido-2,4, 6-trideoxy-beta-L-altropyranose hydrolase n=1 Tax=Vogesella fluminis TaxID=1069161 RepID=A0ABQ3HCM7_9NEIS|nr:UDP-2,4-diacetamido-2,4,6-trideoxy-beta-L-altropyranose hydrolase [Vogesella fluminis]GHD79183.1 UDP-2,4-diacetamido-2,4,6-trideoxy-beta-L-altropyranose hydrolase [Vogesella fluminis]